MRATLLLPLVLAVGCTEPGESKNPDGTEVNPHELVTDDGLYMIHLTPSDDPFPAGEEITLGMHLMADGAGVEGATIAVEPFMPDMGHGIPEAPTVMEMEGGMYEATFTFSMAGYWEVDLTVDGPDGVDHAMAAYEVL